MVKTRAALSRRFKTPAEAVSEIFSGATGKEKVLVVEDDASDQQIFRRYFERRGGRRGVNFEFARVSDGSVDLKWSLEKIRSPEVWAVVLDLALTPDEVPVYGALREKNIVEAWRSFDRERLEERLIALRLLTEVRNLERHLPVTIATRFAGFEALARILSVYGVVGVVRKGEFVIGGEQEEEEWMGELDLFLLQARHEVEMDRLSSEFLLVGQLVSHAAKNLLLDSDERLQRAEETGASLDLEDLAPVRARLGVLQARVGWYLDEVPRVLSATRRGTGPIRGRLELVAELKEILAQPYKDWRPYARSEGVTKSPGSVGIHTYPLLLLLVIEEIVLNTQRHLESSWSPEKEPYLVWAEISQEGEVVMVTVNHNGPGSVLEEGGEPSSGGRLGLPLIRRAVPLLGGSIIVEETKTVLTLAKVSPRPWLVEGS